MASRYKPNTDKRSGLKGPDRFVSGDVALHADKTCVRTDGPMPKFGPAHSLAPQDRPEDPLQTIFGPVSLAIVSQARLDQG